MRKNILILGLMILIVLTSSFAANVDPDENELVINADIKGVSAGAILNLSDYNTTNAKSGVEFYKAIKNFDTSTNELQDLGVLTTAINDQNIGGIVYYSTITAGSKYSLASTNKSKLKKDSVEIPYTIKVGDTVYDLLTSEATEINLTEHKFAAPIKISITEDAILAAEQGVDYADTITVTFTTN